jgi:uncharacterized membrane protein
LPLVGFPNSICVDDFFLFITVMYVADILVRFHGLGWRSFRANGWNIFDIVIATGTLLTTVSVRVGASGYLIDQLQKLFLVSVAFKLVQRMNNLNKLFKTSVYVTSLRMLCFGLFLLMNPRSLLSVQLEFTRYRQSALALDRSVLVLRHLVLGSFQPDQVEYRRDPYSKLLDDGSCARHACFHDYGVRSARCSIRCLHLA